MSTLITFLNIYVARIFARTVRLLGIPFRAIFRGGSFLFVWSVNIFVGAVLAADLFAILGGFVCNILKIKPFLIGPILYLLGIFPESFCGSPGPL